MSDLEQRNKLRDGFLKMLVGINISTASSALHAAQLVVNGYRNTEADKLSFRLFNETSGTN